MNTSAENTLKESPLITTENLDFEGIYILIQTIGRGRSSIVYQAERAQISGGIRAEKMPRRSRAAINSASSIQSLAIKVITCSAKEWEKSRKLLRHEATVSLLLEQDNIIQIFDYVTSAPPYYMVMEYAQKGDLRSMLVRNGHPLPITTVLDYMRQVTCGLEHLHRYGIIHGDIKPDNLLVTADDIVKIADFGTAILPFSDFPSEEISRGVGTFDYLSPEIFQGRGICEASDIYSLGVTAFQLITGALPYDGNSMLVKLDKKLKGTVSPLSSLIPGVPDSLQELISRALEPDPIHRFQSAVEMRRAIDLCIEEIRAKESWG